MKTLLFIQGGSRWKFDEKGNAYTDANFNESVWNRYRKYCDEFIVVLRREEKLYSVEEAERRFNKFDSEGTNYLALPDLYRPVRNVFSFKKKNVIKKEIKEQVEKSDFVIIRSLGNIYTNTALKYAKKMRIPYLVEVTGFAWESLWYHSLRGKMVALFKEIQYRLLMKDVPNAVYVTQTALQKRYPCAGKMLGCSDVEIPMLEESILKDRIEKINGNTGKLIIGTAAFLDVGWKGQEYVIRAIAALKNRGIDCFEYQMIGAGSGRKLIELAETLGVSDQVKIIGTLPHEQVFDWMDLIDVYVQASFMEGLCRSLVEAMSRACPIVCSDVGGNYELASAECLFKKADYKQLAHILEMMMDKEKQLQEAERSFKKANEFQKDLLDKRRDEFYMQIVNE